MTKPVFGAPWHGRVQGGQLLLPIGSSMPYPQPPAVREGITDMPDGFGAAHIVAVPGTPAVVRSPEEQAADTASGRQWRNTAMLSGGRQQLYGKPLDGWIYVDPNGARWLVRCAQLAESIMHDFGAPLSGTLTLIRFGELGGSAESYSYSFSCGWGMDDPGAPSSGRVLLDAIHPAGAAAIVMVHERRLDGDPQIRWPHSFLELTISGPGSAAVVGCSVIKSRTQAIQVSTSYSAGPLSHAGWKRTAPLYNNPVWHVWLDDETPPAGEQWEGRVFVEISGPASLAIRRTLAIWYSAAGVRRDVDFVLSWSGSISCPVPSETGRECSATGAWAASIEVAGSSLSTIAGSWSASSSEVMDGYDWGAYSISSTETVDGIDTTESESGDSYPYVGSWTSVGFGAASGFLSASIDPEEAEYMVDLAFSEATIFAGLGVARYSPQVIGLRSPRPSGYAYHPPATPSGTAPGATSVASDSRKYGAWDPHSGACVWLETTPICYV
ncbi:hypothetical protein D3C78_395770 [compost metagenome]